MSAPAPARFAAVIRHARVLLLDFDGPICAIFAGHPAQSIARHLAQALADDGATVPPRVRDSADPFEVLRFAGTVGARAAEQTEARLRDAELNAVPSASPTPHAEQLIEAWRRTGRAVAAVSNNSEAAVTAYARRRQLALSAIVGRTSADPLLLKPHPNLVCRALDILESPAEGGLLLGDSPSDIEAASRAGLPSIGFANKPGKRERLIAAGATFVIDDLAEVAAEVV